MVQKPMLRTEIMERLFLVFMLFLAPISFAHAQAFDIDSALSALDRHISRSAEYVARKQDNIRQLTERLNITTESNAQFRLAHELYEQYRPFSNDSAIHYIQFAIQLAQRMGNKALAAESQAELAFQCSNTGMYDEALFVLQQVTPSDLDSSGLTAYYRACNHVYSEMAFYTRFDSLRTRYRNQAAHYETLLLAAADSNDVRVLQRREMTYMDKGDLANSLRINDQWMKQVKPDTHPYALTTFYRYLEFKNLGDSTQMMHWLIESAASDVRNAIMDQGSMWELANLLMAKGDIDRAYRYISFASDCATQFGTRLRFWQLSPILSAIDNKYQQYHQHDRQRTRIFLAVLGLLSIILAFTLYDTVRQHRKLKSAHKQVHLQNSQLTTLNAQLSSLNAQLSTANNFLSQSNSVKEEYVAHFMRLCSMYIDKMENFRKRVNRMVKNHEYDDLYQLTRSSEFRDKELEDLYISFDTAFLHLFPNFVGDFNALLKPEEQIEVDENGRLNTSIRIFALIRLGIDDSSKIADFLHYSVNTIYNYRARIKNGALNDRENFEKHVKEIGLYQEN